jgi:lambda family phage minor tail protein L
MSLEQEVNSSETSPYIELFIIDCTIINKPMYYFTTGAASVTFDGQVYTGMGIRLTGVGTNSSAAPARPTLEVQNLVGLDGAFLKLFGTLCFENEDMVGVEITYVRTFQNFLASGFSAPPLKYTIGKKLSHNRTAIKFELRSPLDRDRSFLPKRRMLKKDFPGLGINKRVG